jgi:hypothetical protein
MRYLLPRVLRGSFVFNDLAELFLRRLFVLLELQTTGFVNKETNSIRTGRQSLGGQKPRLFSIVSGTAEAVPLQNISFINYGGQG